MNPIDYWKNFNLGHELAISGSFIYNGLRRFHEMRNLDFTEEVFEFLYELSVGFERILKIAVVLLEHDELTDQAGFEKSLKTHGHLELLARIKKHAMLRLGDQHVALLSLLGDFYRNIRYDRFSLSSAFDSQKEIGALRSFLEKHLSVEIPERSSLLGSANEDSYKRFIRKTILKIANTVYDIVEEQASSLNLYTYELRHGSKAESVFLRKVDVSDEDVLWKELIIFFMNTESSSGYLKFLREITPLEFDPYLAGDYLDCFRSDAAKGMVMDELEHLYEETVEDVGGRLALLGVVGAPNVSFACDDDIDDDELEFKEGPGTPSQK